MRIALIGAGGIGSFYVCRLMQAGHDVLAVARGAHLEAMRAHGLRVEHAEHPYEGPVPVCALPELLDRDPGSIDLVVLLTKSTATAELAGQFGPWIGDASTSVLSLQNGVDNEVVLSEALGRERIVGGYSVRLGGHVVAPGHVRRAEWHGIHVPCMSTIATLLAAKVGDGTLKP